jgi:hypothetical protein
MTELTSPPESSAPPLGLATRIVGVIFSPRSTYAAIVSRPAVAGVLVVTLLVSGGLAVWLFSSEAGQHAMLAQIEARSGDMPAQQQRAVETFITIIGYAIAAVQVVLAPLIIALVALLLKGILNFVYGEKATFKQAFAVVAHSSVVITVVSMLSTPLMYVKEDLVSPTRLAVLLPMLPEQGFLTALCNSIDLWVIWWLCNLSIGLAVLYKRKTGGLASTFLGLYGCIALLVATLRSSFS